MSQNSVASIACFPKHNLTVCLHELHFPLQEETKQTQSGVLFTDVKSPWIRSVRSVLSEREGSIPWFLWAHLPPSRHPTGEEQVKAADVTTGSRDGNLIGCRAEKS